MLLVDMRSFTLSGKKVTP